MDGVARLPRGSLVAPLFHRLDKPNNIRGGERKHKLQADWIVREYELFELVPELLDGAAMFNSVDMTWLDDGADPLEWATIKFDQPVYNRIKGILNVGFILFVTDLKPYY